MKLTIEDFAKAQALLDAISLSLDMQGKFYKYEKGIQVLYDILCQTEIIPNYED